MKQDAFTEGVEPGGLWNKNDIRILICYILSSVKAPLSGEDITAIMQKKALANYFEVGDALMALLKMENIAKDDKGCYTVTDTGEEIAQSLDATLPLSVRDKALEAAFTLLADARTQRENRVDINKTPSGYQVECHISGGDKMELLALSLYVPDLAQAEMVKRSFHRDPAGIYKLLLSSLTGDMAFAKSYFEENNTGKE